ncbi:MAG: MATE family efflux transporter [Bacteroidia bacterium]|nr:MATE family efflux transporter [Bacteroidia bacterium]
MAGGIGAEALAASGLANNIFFVVAVIGFGVLSIVAPLVAAAKGQQDEQRCSRLLSNAGQIALGLSILIMGVLLLIAANFYLFEQDPEVERLSIIYLSIIALSSVPMLLFLAYKNFADGLSITQPAMHVTFVCVLLNVLFNWLLIYGKLGFPALGLTGAGIATLLSRVCMAVGIIAYVFNSQKICRYLPDFSFFRYNRDIFLKILRLGLPAGFQSVFEVGAFAGASVIVGWLGTNQLAAHQIALNLSTVTYMVATGLPRRVYQSRRCLWRAEPNQDHPLWDSCPGAFGSIYGL